MRSQALARRVPVYPFTIFGPDSKNARPEGGLHLSATRNKTFMRHCKRLWAFQHIGGEKQAERDWHLFGRKAHGIAESYLREGVLPDAKTVEGRTFLTGVQHWPAPDDTHLVEDSFATKLANGEWFTGTMDFAQGRPERFPELAWAKGYPVLGDHKFIADFEYAMTADELVTDVQVLAYAWHVLEMWDRASPDGKVACQWVYYKKPTKKEIEAGAPKYLPAKAVRAFVTREQAKAGWDEVVEASDEMVSLWRANTDPMSIPAPACAGTDTDEDPCNAFGGCFFKYRCFPNSAKSQSLIDSFFATKPVAGEESMSVFNRFQGQQAAPQQQQQPAPQQRQAPQGQPAARRAPPPQDPRLGKPVQSTQGAVQQTQRPAPQQRTAAPQQQAPARQPVTQVQRQASVQQQAPQQQEAAPEEFALFGEQGPGEAEAGFEQAYDAAAGEGDYLPEQEESVQIAGTEGDFFPGGNEGPEINAGAPELSPQAAAIMAAREAEQAEADAQAAAAAAAPAPAPAKRLGRGRGKPAAVTHTGPAVPQPTGDQILAAAAAVAETAPAGERELIVSLVELIKAGTAALNRYARNG